jgi:hypothetical protein
MQVVNGRQSSAQDLIDFLQVMNVGAREVLAGIALAIGLNRTGIVLKLGVFEL